MAAGAINQRWRTAKTIAWAFAAVVLAALLDRSTFFHHTFKGPIARFEPIMSDFLAYRVFTPAPPTGNVVIAAIDDKSIAELGRFPWPRSVEARLVDALAADGAKVIAFDMFFGERDPADVERGDIAARLRAAGIDDAKIAQTLGTSGDEAFARAENKAGNVIIAYSFHHHLAGTRRATDEAPAPMTTVPAPTTYNLVRRYPGADRTPAVAYAYLAPVAELNRAAHGAAYVDIDEDEDGTARSYPAVVLLEGRYCAPLFIAAAQAYLGNPSLSLDLGRSGVTSVAVGKRVVAVDELGRMMIHYRGRAGTIPRYSVADIIARRVPPDALRGKIVVVGVTAHALGDRFVTPVGGDFPGVEVQAMAIDNVLAGDFLHRSLTEKGEEQWAGWIFGVAIGVATAWMSAGISLVLLLLSALAYAGYAAWRFYEDGAMLGVFFPLVALTLSYLAAISYRYRTEGREKRYLRSAFEMYLHPDVITAVVDHPEGLKLGGQRHHLSILFADIVGFTERAERLEPEPLVAMLNTYMSVMTEVILESGGVVDKLMGDGIMAFWGAPLKIANPSRAAIECALTMLEQLHTLAAKDERFREVKIGIGISTGEAIVGNLGGERKFDYSAVGDTVNLASRLEGLTRQFKVDLIVSGATLDEAGYNYVAREIGLVRVKGREQPARVIEIVGHAGDGIDSSYYDRFAQAIAGMRTGIRPEPALRALLAERPDDAVAAIYLGHLGRAEGPASGELIFTFDTK